MPRNTRKSSTEPNPLYAIAGAGDLAVEKIREISKIATDKLGSLETADPAVVSDRVQERIEERADALAMVLRTASDDLRIQAKDLTEKAQSAVQMALIQAGDTYETLSERGKGAVIRIRSVQNGSSNGRQIARTGSSSRPSASRSKSTTTRKRSTAKRSAKPRTAASSTAKSTAAKSTAAKPTAKSGTPRKNSSAPARKATS
ncbi:hypothetical protein ABN028_24910 [Actinopolymorpha sp. B17G11]|uniref:hypothetical protein n=1 Tax=Actinopolymorpha sp. B17G11 TaxID=3160861 RepID=UPI0032E4EBA6